jgi:hypothetical protein
MNSKPYLQSESLASQVWQLECVREKEGEQNLWELLYVFDEVERYQVDFGTSPISLVERIQGDNPTAACRLHEPLRCYVRSGIDDIC